MFICSLILTTIIRTKQLPMRKTLKNWKSFFQIFCFFTTNIFLYMLQGGQSVAGHCVPGGARPVPRRDAQPGRLLLGAPGGQARQPGGRRRGHWSNLLRAGGPHLPLHRIFRQLQVRESRLRLLAPCFDSIDTSFLCIGHPSLLPSLFLSPLTVSVPVYLFLSFNSFLWELFTSFYHCFGFIFTKSGSSLLLNKDPIRIRTQTVICCDKIKNKFNWKSFCS